MPEAKYSVVTYCPSESTSDVIRAMGDAGAGALGEYRYAAYITSGAGNWMDPGATGMSQEKEDKIEMICDEEKLEEVAKAIRHANPYGADSTVEAFPVTML